MSLKGLMTLVIVLVHYLDTMKTVIAVFDKSEVSLIDDRYPDSIIERHYIL